MVDNFLSRFFPVSESFDRVQQHDRQFLANEPIGFPLPVLHPTGLAVEPSKDGLVVLQKCATELLLDTILELLPSVGDGGEDVLTGRMGSVHESPARGSRLCFALPHALSNREQECLHG